MAWGPKSQQYLKEHLSLYVFVSVLFVIGVIFGAIMVNALSLEQREEMSRFFGGFFHLINLGDQLNAKVTFQQVLGMHMKWLLLIWLFGLSVIGMPLILVLDFLKGVLVGFTVGYLAAQLSWQGILFSLAAVVPQNLIIIPVLLITSVSAIAFSIHLVKNRLIQRSGNVYRPFVQYSVLALSMAVLLFGVSILEAFLSPGLMKWVTPTLGIH